ncbi:MAG TPA: tRNA (guanosine(46)-N7)-methyltransferase TrmB [Anaerovoracaceae bacterium]|nr:tRNA (guanosine(46)-N7)-methyltransferase TrmB [Anaerovoracaceae bacterium]
MRQRSIKNVDEKILKYKEKLVFEPEIYKGKWKELFDSDNNLHLEIGSGKGDFIIQMAEKYPDRNFIAIEGNKSVLYKSLQKLNVDYSNLIFIPTFVDDIKLWFAKSEISTVYMNFSDPWPKNRLAKKRLTHRIKLVNYFYILTEDGTIEFKTDNDEFFEYSLREVVSLNIKLSRLSRNLHAGDFAKENVMTEYERKFSDKGKSINYFKINKGENGLENGGFATLNGRNIPIEDKIFGISMRANRMIKEKGKDAVINGTVGSLLDDEGELVVLSSVDKAVKTLKPKEYAEYAPIAGTIGYREAIKKATFGDYVPNANVEVVATPGGTGAIRNTISNYSALGDRVLTSDWFWAPYKTIAGEIGRSVDTFELFEENGKFNIESLKANVKKLLKDQKNLVIILNTPAHNPTGYSLTLDDWNNVIEVLNEVGDDRKVALLVDVAYIDFAGDEQEYRKFMPLLENLNRNVLPIIAYSTSKTFTFYGFRCGAMMCMAKNKEVSDEFLRVCSYSSRGSWSNCARAPQTVIEKIFNDKELLELVEHERLKFRKMLIERGKAFADEADKIGLEMVPFDAGFFISIPCKNPDEVCNKLEQKGVFIVPLAKGLRVSIASISEEKCKMLPRIIKESM